MANRWGNSGNSVRLYYFGLQNHCRWWLQPWIILGRKVMTNLDSIFKSRDITLLTKVHLVKAMVFPVGMHGCESWKANIKKAEHWRIDAFELRFWIRLLRVPWTARKFQPVHPKGNQSWIFIGIFQAWSASVHWVTKSQTRLSNWTELNCVIMWRKENNEFI